MAILASMQDRLFWVGPPITSTNTTYFDPARVSHAIQAQSGNDIAMLTQHSVPANSEVWYACRYYKQVSSGAGDDGDLADVHDVVGTLLAKIDFVDGKLRAVSYGDTIVSGVLTSVISGGTHDFKMKVDVTPAAITTELWWDGVMVSTATSANTVESKGVARSFTWTNNDAIFGLTYFSEFCVYDVNPGSGRYTRLGLLSDGTDTDLAGGFADLVDEDVSTSLESSASNQKSSWNLAAYTAGDSISDVSLTAWVEASTGSSGNFRFYLLIGGVRYYGVTQPITGTQQLLAGDSWSEDPSDNTPWTAAKVNAVEVGFETLP